MNRNDEELLRIGELASASGVSVTTVKYYVKEGLIHPACKTGRNMAYYDRSCIDAIAVIRKLQRERYYPLSVIRRLLDAAPVEQMEMDLLDAIYKVDPTACTDDMTLAQAAKKTNLTARQIGQLMQAGLIAPIREGGKKLFSAADVSVMALARRRLDAGIPFEQTVRSFSIYEHALREAASADVDAFAAGALMVEGVTAEAGAQMIRVSDETLDSFISLRRKAMNREFGSRRLEDLSRFDAALLRALVQIEALLRGAGIVREADLCAAVLAQRPTGDALVDQAAAHYRGFARFSGDTARALAECVRARAYFSTLEIEPRALALRCMKAGFLSLSPPILDCSAQAREALDDLAAVLSSALFQDIRRVLTGGNP